VSASFYKVVHTLVPFPFGFLSDINKKTLVGEAGVGERSGGLGSPAWAGEGFYNSYEGL
jgi:hypothetical protein